MVSHIFSLVEIISKFEPSFVEDIKMVARFGCVLQYVVWFIFMYQVTSKSRLKFYSGEVRAVEKGGAGGSVR